MSFDVARAQACGSTEAHILGGAVGTQVRWLQ
jgi:hypothetical protein